MYERMLKNKLPQSSFFLFGPRQVGKSTLLKLKKYDLSLDLLNPELQLQYSKNPNLLTSQVRALPSGASILIDEVQKAPQLLDIIHLLIEENPSHQFILCGSSARKLRHGAANLLGGRALYRTLHPLTYEELGSDFNLDNVLSYGSLPKIYECLAQNNTALAIDLLRTYSITYLKEEIKAEAIVRNLQSFQMFLDIAAGQFAEQINFTGLARDCQIAGNTARQYYTILQDTLIGEFLYPYLKSTRKRMSHQPKFYFFDNGVTRSLLGTLNSPRSSLETGRLFEQWIVQEVFRINAYYQKDFKLNFWRTSSGAEVDLMISRGASPLLAVECKSNPRIANADLKGLKAFQKDHPDVESCLVAPIEHEQIISQIKIHPPRSLFKRLIEI